MHGSGYIVKRAKNWTDSRFDCYEMTTILLRFAREFSSQQVRSRWARGSPSCIGGVGAFADVMRHAWTPLRQPFQYLFRLFAACLQKQTGRSLGFSAKPLS